MAINQWRSENQTSVASSVPSPYIPSYALLFYYNTSSSMWSSENSANNGVLNQDYYRQTKEFLNPNQTYNPTPFGDNGGPGSGGWNNNLCQVNPPSLRGSLDSTYATLLDIGGSHNPQVIGFRTIIPYSWGSKSGDVLTKGAGNTYTIQTAAVSGHYHSVDGSALSSSITNSIKTNPYGVVASDGSINTIDQQLAITIPLLRDPNLIKGPEKLFWLPKNILVFGNNLPSPNYSQTDSVHIPSSQTRPAGYGQSGNTLTGSNSAILSFGLNYSGYFDGQNNDWTTYSSTTGYNVGLYSNTSGYHNHTGVPVRTGQVSTNNNQKANVLQSSGSHSHFVSYNMSLGLNVTKLKGWITQSETTPVANGVIIGYALSNSLGYTGPDADSTGNLPPGWFFCNGSNGTPDLRNQYILVNMNPSDPDHGVQLSNGAAPGANNVGMLTVNNITVQANGYHSHVLPSGKNISSSKIYGTAVDLGSHDFETGTNHVHQVSAAVTFVNPATGQYALNITNSLNNQFQLLPPSINIGFIMYNNAITP